MSYESALELIKETEAKFVDLQIQKEKSNTFQFLRIKLMTIFSKKVKCSTGPQLRVGKALTSLTWC
jgi:hypothetical protein